MNSQRCNYEGSEIPMFDMPFNSTHYTRCLNVRVLLDAGDPAMCLVRSATARPISSLS